MNSETPSTLDAVLIEFIAVAIPSVWALETLLLLKRSSDRTWDMPALVGELRASTLLVAQCQEALQKAGLIQIGPAGAHYAPASVGLGRLCDRLEDAYRDRSVSVIKAIVSQRADPLKNFANSFRLRGWKP